LLRFNCKFRSVLLKYPKKEKFIYFSSSAPLYDSNSSKLMFSSTGDPSSLVSKLGVNRISSVIVTGKPHRAMPQAFNLDLEGEFFPGAKAAVEVVTKLILKKEWDSLNGLLTEQCIQGIQHNMTQEFDVIKPDDIFLTFISNSGDSSFEGGNNLNLVTFSFPNLGDIKLRILESDGKLKAFKQQLNNPSPGTDPKLLLEDIREFQEDFKANNPYNEIREGDFIIGNFRFKRSSPTSEWEIHEVGLIDSSVALPFPFKFRWKGRLLLSLRMKTDFLNVLRYDYATDYIASLFIITYLFLSSGATSIA